MCPFWEKEGGVNYGRILFIIGGLEGYVCMYWGVGGGHV